MNILTVLKRQIGFAAMLAISATAFAQTNPAPQALPYSQNFNDLPHTSTTYPAGWQGWMLELGAGANPPGASEFRLTPAIDDELLTLSGNAGIAAGRIYNYNGKIGFLNTETRDHSIALALNTTGHANIVVWYDIMTIRNPHDGGSNTRINEVILQYRIGTTGNFTNLFGTEYQNNTINQIAGTDPQNLQQRTITLPAAANNQPVVQLRWASRQVSGGGSRPSFAVDNITVTGTETGAPAVVATPAFNPNGGVFYAPVDVSITSATASADIFFSSAGPTGPWTPYTAPINLTATTTLWAYASKAGMTDSEVASAVFTFDAIGLSNNAELQSLTLGGRNALPLRGIVVNDTVADAGAIMFVADFAGFAGIVAIPEDTAATFSVTLNGTLISPANLPTVALSNGDVVVVRVLAADGQTWWFYKVTLVQNRSLALIRPVGGETYHTGDTIIIEWTSQNVSELYLLVFEGGQIVPLDGFPLPAAQGSFPLGTVPNGLHGQFFFRLVNADDTTHFVNSGIINVIDNVAPSINLLMPENNSLGIATTTDFVIEADEPVSAIAGRNIRLRRVYDNALIETLPANSPLVVIQYEEISFTFETRLAPATTYEITVDAGAFVDINNNPLPAITANAWRFTTRPLICNGDFEAWTFGKPDCWFGFRTDLAPDSVVQYTVAPQSGLSAVRLIRTETEHRMFTSEITSVVEGRTYRISFWVKGGGDISTGLFDNREGESRYFFNHYITVDSATWQQFTQEIVADNTIDFAEFIFSVRNTVAGMGHIHIDNVSIIEVPVIPVVDVPNLTALRSREAGETVRVTGEIVLSFQQNYRNQKFFQDAGAAIMVDDPAGIITTVYALGNGIRNLTGTLAVNNGMLQLVPISDPGAATSTGNTLVPVERTLASLTSADQARLVRIRNVRFEATGNFATAMNYNLTSPDGNGVFRTMFPAADYIGVAIPTQHLNLTAIVSQFQAQMQVTARSMADFEVATFVPEIPAGAVSVFPNPFSDYITISSHVKLTRVSLIDNTGRTVAEFGPVTGSLTITTGDLQPGLYLIRLVAADGTQLVKKLMKR